MVLQKTVDNLRARPHRERRAIARGIAAAVVAILFIGWAILFFRDIRAKGIQVEPIGIPGKSAFETPQFKEARDQIQSSFGGLKKSIQAAQNSSEPVE